MLKEKTFWADTEFFGLLGTPVRKSLSPAMHNANFHALGMNAVTPYSTKHVEVIRMNLRFKDSTTSPNKKYRIP